MQIAKLEKQAEKVIFVKWQFRLAITTFGWKLKSYEYNNIGFTEYFTFKLKSLWSRMDDAKKLHILDGVKARREFLL